MTIAAIAVTLLATACKFPYPADVPDDDVTTIDAAVDARVRTRPLVQSNQAADIVIGAANFTTMGGEPLGPSYILYATGIAGDRDNLWIADIAPIDRVTRFSPFPSASFPEAVAVVGRPTLTDETPIGAPDRSNVRNPGGVALTEDALVVVDSGGNRVLIWTPPPTTNGAPASIVLGQPNFGSQATGVGADQMNYPRDVWTDGVRLVVSDPGNHRVLVWNTFPRSNGQPADIAIGQSGFGMGAAPTRPSATRLKDPGRITSNGTWLAVSDGGHNRVLIWRTFPGVSGAAADVVIGQDSMDTQANDVMTARRLSSPAGLATADGALFVADSEHHRVLVFDPVPVTSVSDVSTAAQSLGQVNPGVFEVGDLSSRSVTTPVAIAVVDRYLFVSDWFGERVLRFRLDLP